jgi:hypothetical protein
MYPLRRFAAATDEDERVDAPGFRAQRESGAGKPVAEVTGEGGLCDDGKFRGRRDASANQGREAKDEGRLGRQRIGAGDGFNMQKPASEPDTTEIAA